MIAIEQELDRDMSETPASDGSVPDMHKYSFLKINISCSAFNALVDQADNVNEVLFNNRAGNTVQEIQHHKL
jgi:hypothetical protein